jgi:DNA polymerase-1
MTRPKLILIDGHALAYRQYFALPIDKFTTARGEPTNATYGFARTLLDILQANPPPDYLAVTFDQGVSGRNDLYPDYKGTRDKMHEELAVQVNRIRELVQAFNIPILEQDGFEADDVIGSAAKQAIPMGVDVHIITGDRDLLQLVNEHTVVQLPGKTQGDAQMYDTERVVLEYGIRPEQIPDYKGFVGDTSDNIPGVQGIGEKTAAQLLQQYETLEGVYANIEQQKGSKLQKLEAGRDSAFLSKKLAQIMLDIPISLELEKCVAHDYDPIPVAKLFRILEFRSLGQRLPATAVPDPSGQLDMFAAPATEPAVDPDAPQRANVNTTIVDTEETLAAMIQVLNASPTIAVDTETTGTDQMRATLVGISLAVNDHEGYYIPVGHVAPNAEQPAPRQLPPSHVIEALRPALTAPSKPKYMHNAAYDLIMLRRYGLDVTPIAFDTMIAEWLLNPDSRRKGLKDQAEDRLNVQMTHIQELIGKGKTQITMDRVPVEQAAPYAAADAAITFRLVEEINPQLVDKRLIKLFEEIEMPLIPVIADLDMNGVKLDLPYLGELSREFAERLNSYQDQIYAMAGDRFNIGSPKQLNDILFGKLQLPTTGLSKSAHGFSLDAEALDSLKDYHPMVGLLLEWRTLEKLKTTYVDSLNNLVDEHGRIHTTYNQTGSVTGRVSSETPNLQNIPVRTEEGRRVRKAFIAEQGHHLLSVDYSQIELRILASYSKDPLLLESFAQDRDIHRATAAVVYSIPFDQVTKEQRYFAKRVNFGLIYGMGAFRLARESGLKLYEAQDFIEKYFQRFPGIKSYFDGVKTQAELQGYLETLKGRRRYFHALRPADKSRISSVLRARAEREAINMPIQGTAADIMKISMIRLSQRLKAEKSRARLILQVHDELVLEVPDEDIQATASLVCEVMEGAMELAVPLKVESNIGVNWAEMEPLSVQSR